MKNLAGVETCDNDIRKELLKAGICVVRHRRQLKGEVPATLTGKLGPFEFERAWYYWMVSGEVPLDVAEKMYANRIGRKDVRVAGNAGCPHPREWAFPKNRVLKKYFADKDFGSVSFGELAKLCNTGQIIGPRFVNTYHIDSQAGLNLFVRTIMSHGLDKV